jgi:hypothetical protein
MKPNKNGEMARKAEATRSSDNPVPSLASRAAWGAVRCQMPSNKIRLCQTVLLSILLSI